MFLSKVFLTINFFLNIILLTDYALGQILEFFVSTVIKVETLIRRSLYEPFCSKIRGNIP